MKPLVAGLMIMCTAATATISAEYKKQLIVEQNAEVKVYQKKQTKSLKFGEKIVIDQYSAQLVSITIPTNAYKNGRAIVSLYKDKEKILEGIFASGSSIIYRTNKDTIAMHIRKIIPNLDPGRRQAEISLSIMKR